MVDVTLLVTSASGVACGVADYTDQLARAVAELGGRVVVEKPPTWSFGAARRTIAARKSDPNHIFHIQYPSLGMGKSPAPGLFPVLARGHRVFLTLHEFELFNPVRKAYLLPHSFGSGLVFTNAHERAQFKKVYPWAQGAIIPVGNNIGAPDRLPAPDQRQGLVYFGQIAPGKGIEDYIATVAALRASGDGVRCAIVGAEVDPDSDISRLVRDAAGRLGIDLHFNLPAEHVSAELCRARIALLPFPDGVGDKRGSALACIRHGLALVTRHSELTPDWWRRTTYDARDAQEAAAIVARLAQGALPQTQDAALLQRSLDEREWRSIANAHMALYARSGPKRGGS